MATFATKLYGTAESPAEGKAPAATATEAEIAKRDEKLKLAQTHPTDVSQLGSVPGAQLVSDEEALSRMENMSVEEQIAYMEANPALAQRMEGAA